GWRGSNMQNSSMNAPDRYSDEYHGPIQEDLRQRIAAAIQDRGSVLVWDTVAIFPFSGTELLEPEYCNRMGEIVIQLLDMAVRDGQSVSLILFDVDHLSTINQEHGYGVGDRILERLGILIRQYFRQYDWVARHSEDSIAVLLSGTDAAHASELAERVRATVEERLGFTDHRNDRPVVVTLSVA